MKGTIMAKKRVSAKAKAKPKTKSKARSKSSAPTGRAPQSLNGWITHTELASLDPNSTKKWCAKVLGWKFRPSFPMQDGGEYLLFMYSDKGGGGIRPNNPPEVPGTIPYVQVASVKAAFAKAIREGAEEMFAPEKIMDDLFIAIVRAPGGVPIGLAGPK
jgi:uncharacterized protein